MTILLTSDNVIPELDIFMSDKVDVINPKFKTREGAIVSHETYSGGNITSNNDHRISFSLNWDIQNIYLEVIVNDDTHHVHGQSDWAGDSLQLSFTNKDKSEILFEMSTAFYGKNAEYNLDSIINNLVLWDKYRYNKDGIVLLIQKSQTTDNDSLINNIEIKRDENSKKTFYKLTINYKYIQTSPFKNGQTLGFSLMANDGDYVDIENDDGVEIIHLTNDNNSIQIIKNDPILQIKPIAIALKVNSNNNSSYKLLKKGVYDISVINNILYLNNNVVIPDISKNYLLVINMSNVKSNIFYCIINTEQSKVTKILEKDITINYGIESFFQNTDDIIIGKEVIECIISNRIIIDGLQPTWNTQNEEPGLLQGQRGWSGWFPNTLLYPQNPKYAGLINLNNGREFDQIVSADIKIKKCDSNHFKIIFSKKNISSVLMYQVGTETYEKYNNKRFVSYVDAKKWVAESFSQQFKPTAVMEISKNNKYAFILNNAKINTCGNIIFYITTDNILTTDSTNIPSGEFKNVKFNISNNPITISQLNKLGLE